MRKKRTMNIMRRIILCGSVWFFYCYSIDEEERRRQAEAEEARVQALCKWSN